jgi:TM2 domain-containing membrane protein YozV
LVQAAAAGVGIACLLACWTFVPAIIAWCQIIHWLWIGDAGFDARYNHWRQITPRRSANARATDCP